MNTDKITKRHLSRKAVVYIRQSTINQVHNNQESQRRQYGLVESARGMGFSSVDVIDDDLGISGSGKVDRPGFERLVIELTAGEVGGVFCLEASRLSRNSKDWHALLEICAMAKAVIIDPDGIYDPTNTNDRLLLGLKGTLSEYELTLLRQRAHEAKRLKAERGELQFPLPAGLCWQKDGRMALHPDRRVRETIQTVFSQYRALGSMRRVLHWFYEHDYKFPVRPAGSWGGPGDDEIFWDTPVISSIRRALTSPLYAGAYVWGRTAPSEGTGTNEKPTHRWKVLILEHHPGYVSWQDYLRNRACMSENHHKNPLTPRKEGRGGNALLIGLLRCGRCGRRLVVQYSRENVHRYACCGTRRQNGGPSCFGFAGRQADEAVADAVLAAVRVPALEAAIQAADEASRQREADVHLIELELSQAKYRARLAGERYDAVDPHNRLVAPELERRWNVALEEVQSVEARLHERSERETRIPTKRELLRIAEDLPSVWADQCTDMRLKQRIVATVIDEITVFVDDAQGVVRLTIRWQGGRHSEVLATRRRANKRRLKTKVPTLEIVKGLGPYCSEQYIVAVLNRLGLKTLRGRTWTAAGLQGFRHAYGLTDEVFARLRDDNPTVTLIEAARRLNVATSNVRRLIARGVLPATQVVPYAPWRVSENALSEPAVHAAAVAIRNRGNGHTHGSGQQNLFNSSR